MYKTILTVLALFIASPFIAIGGAQLVWKLPVTVTARIAFDKTTANQLIAFSQAQKKFLNKWIEMNSVEYMNACDDKVRGETGFTF